MSMTPAQIAEDILNRFNSVFSMMEIAGKLVDQYAMEEEDTVTRDLLYGSFVTMHTPYPMSDEMYKAHCRELLDRIKASRGKVKQGKINLLTDAEKDVEILYSLRNASAVTPINSEGTSLYMTLFARVYPEKYASLDLGIKIPEPYPGVNDRNLKDIKLSNTKLRYMTVKRNPPNPRIPYWIEQASETEVPEEPQQLSLFD